MKQQSNSTKNSKFQASTWLKRFNSRHDLRELRIQKEKLASDGSDHLKSNLGTY